jgi:osmotically inducible lipoprotein OsmB
MENEMKSFNRLTVVAALSAAAMTLAGCSGMSRQTRDTAAGAAIGGVAGSVLTGGSTTGTVGGAVVGGVIGNQNAKDRR